MSMNTDIVTFMQATNQTVNMLKEIIKLQATRIENQEQRILQLERAKPTKRAWFG